MSSLSDVLSVPNPSKDPPFKAKGRARRDPPANLAFDPLWAAALRADGEAVAHASKAPSAATLADAWDDLVRGQLTILCESIGAARVQLLACVEPAAASRDLGALSAADARMVLRVLGGEPQKVVAADLGIAPSTASRRYLHSLETLGLSSRRVPLLLILAAQSRLGVGPLPDARSVAFEDQGCACVLLSVPRPRAPESSGLSYAEREVAHLLVESCSAREIAHRRSTSIHTAMRQVHAVFSKLKVTGRCELIRCAVMGGWFR